MDAIYPLHQITNRHQRRMFEQESHKIYQWMEEVNSSFVNQLFSEFSTHDYDYLYQKHLELWIKRYEYIVKHEKPLFVAIDQNWFEKNYKPAL